MLPDCLMPQVGSHFMLTSLQCWDQIVSDFLHRPGTSLLEPVPDELVSPKRKKLPQQGHPCYGFKTLSIRIVNQATQTYQVDFYLLLTVFKIFFPKFSWHFIRIPDHY